MEGKKCERDGGRKFQRNEEAESNRKAGTRQATLSATEKW